MVRPIDSHAGENYYFGVSEQNGEWLIVSLGVDTDCDV